MTDTIRHPDGRYTIFHNIMVYGIGKNVKKTTVVLLNTRSFYNQCNYFATLGFSNYNRNTIFSCFVPFNTSLVIALNYNSYTFTSRPFEN